MVVVGRPAGLEGHVSDGLCGGCVGGGRMCVRQCTRRQGMRNFEMGLL